MKVGIATDHGGFALKEDLLAKLNAAGHQVVDFGAHSLKPDDDYPDFVVPLAQAVVSGKVDRGVAICGSGVGAAVCANKVSGVRAGLIHDHFSARQGVEDDHMNILCMGGRTVGPAVAWDLVQAYLAAEYSQAERHLRRLGKVASIETQRTKTQNASEERPMSHEQAAQLSINTIRTLSIDAVQQAKSGHPGTPMALAPLVYTIWNRVMSFDPQDPIWPNRDRFVLSNGHASMLLWSILHLTQVQAVNAEYERLGHASVTLDDIRRFRQLDSKAPGHPEYHWVSGVETTTGPLGQGVATSVGMALAQKWLANRYNRPGFDIFDYKIYTVCGDGCMMEGVGSEAASLAAHLGLDNLCWIWDNNHITIEGHTSITFTEDVAARFLAYGWNVLRVGDANDIDRIEHALEDFRHTKGRPTFIVLDSHIGYGSPHKQDTSAAHGEPLGDDEVRLVKRAYGWPEDAKFLVPDGVYDHFAAGIGKRGHEARQQWMELFAAYREKYPALATEIEQMQKRELPAGWDRNFPVFPADPKGIAGRDASGKVLNILAQNIPWFFGGSGDLGPSNKTTLTYEGAGNFQAATPGGKNLHFGIREHAMGAIVNGMSLSKLRPFGATFFIFSDYARPAIRLGALMELPVLFAFTHDAMGDGEDGPTHQPVEQLASLRAIPGLVTLRPADANEVVEAYRYVVQLRHQPAVLALSRQPLPTFDRSKYAAASGVSKGAYVLADTPGGKPDVILIASGSEVSLAVEAHEKLRADGIRSRVVSMPSWDIFEHQTQEYRNSVLPPDVTARVAIEQASTFGWERYVGLTGRVIGMHTFGASAPLKELQKKFGFEPYEIVAAAKEQIGRRAA
jgi:transketolase